MKEILKLNKISGLADKKFGDGYVLTEESDSPTGIILRSYNMHGYTPAGSVLCVGRAGAGVNNIPLDEYAEKGIVVFNTPGANANAVKELTLFAFFAAARNAVNASRWANGLVQSDKTIAEQVESGKKAFVGTEISGKTAGVYGLGAIGGKVALALKALGMKVVGYDPYLSDAAAFENADITIVDSKEKLFALSDYITLHVPFTAETKHVINAESISKMKDGVKIINCARGELVNDQDLSAAVEAGKISSYVTDFPTEELLNKDGVTVIPHLGASTEEAEENCAEMVADDMKEYIENGNISRSVNYPAISAEKGANRLIALFTGENTQGEIVKLLPLSKCVITTKMRRDTGVILVDTDEPLSADVVEKIARLSSVKKVRTI